MKNIKKDQSALIVAFVWTALKAGKQMGKGHVVDIKLEGDIFEAVKNFQKWVMEQGTIEGILDDGEIGEKTIRALAAHVHVDLTVLPDSVWEILPEEEVARTGMARVVK